MDKFIEFRTSYKDFIYHSYDIKIEDGYLKIVYNFEIVGLSEFHPTLEIPIDDNRIKNKSREFIEYLVFHIGLVELISYWKCAAPENVTIEAGYIDDDQIEWFKKLYYYGLGEFFFRNGINVSIDTFMDITVKHPKVNYHVDYSGNGNLIPIGGGKDSCVTLDLLKNENDNKCFIINPKKVTMDCAYAAGYEDKDIIGVKRTICKNLIELNKRGFLNGHTPFSSMVAFVSYLTAYLHDKKNITLSNESSANESNVEGTKINHQYSKTYEFENDFNSYTTKYFNIDIKYFSLLRPLSEYQIGMLFSKLDRFHTIFKSCNVGSKGETWQWCCDCPKCLFVYSILSPHLYKDKIVNIFGEDLFEKESLLDTFIELLGFGETKPFECVGTYEEVNYSVSKLIKRLGDEKLPYLLQYYKDNYDLVDTDSIDLEHQYNNEHNLDEYFETIVKEALK